MPRDNTPPRQHLSRADMEKIIKEGGSVIYRGEHILKIEDLPSETDLVIGDASAEEARARTLRDQIETLKAEEARLAQAHAERAAARTAAARAATSESEAEPAPRRGKKPGPRKGSRRKATPVAASPVEKGEGEGDSGDGEGEGE
jgi:hypothetical protein